MSNANVLLVDDELGFTETLSERLELRGLNVSIANSGQEAIALAKHHRFDAVILDLQMPGMDGIDTLKQLLNIDADQRVLILTGHGTVTKGVEAIKAGASEFLEKPVDIKILTEKIGAAALQRVMLIEERSARAIDDILKRRGW